MESRAVGGPDGHEEGVSLHFLEGGVNGKVALPFSMPSWSSCLVPVSLDLDGCEFH